MLAGSLLYKREITIEQHLLRFRHELGRIFVHEIFHFVWLRLGNPLRRSFEELLDREFERRARGELGWSAESLKRKLSGDDRLLRTKRWREYACESFCDTAAWAFGSSGRYAERTLARRFRDIRREWLMASLFRRPLSI